MIANILRARQSWLVLSSWAHQTWHPCTRTYTVHSPCAREVTLPHPSNSVLRFENTRVLSKKHSALSLVSKAPDLRSLMQIFMRLASLMRPTSQTQERICLLYGVHKTSSHTAGKEATRLHSNTIKYNIGKISLTAWSLFQCQCYRYNTNVPVRRRNSNGMPRSKPGSENKKEGLE